eukprot:PITA_08405
MVEEYDSIIKNSVWDVVPKPIDKSVVSSRWIYKVKKVADGSVERHKARFVAQVFFQVEGIDCDETFAHVARGSCKRVRNEGLGAHALLLGMEVWQGEGELFVSQGKYANEILKRFHMESSKPIETPLAGNWRKEDATSGEVVKATIYRQLVGSLIYLVNTQSNMCYEINQIIQEMVRPTKLYFKEIKHVLRYLRGTTQYGLWYRWTKGVKLQGFIDVDWVGNPFHRKSTSRGISNIGSIDVSWYSKKQRLVALGSGEAKYMISSQATCETIWMRKILVCLFGQQMDPAVIYCDNEICIKLYENIIIHDRSKYIDIWYHHLRDCVQRRIMLLEYIPPEDQDADILTKALFRCKFEFHRDRSG